MDEPNEFEQLINKLESSIDVINAHKNNDYDLIKEYYRIYFSPESSIEESSLALKGFSIFSNFDSNFYKIFTLIHIDDLYNSFPSHFDRPFTDSILILLLLLTKEKKPTKEIVERICSTISMALDEDQHPTQTLKDSIILIHRIIFEYKELIEIIINSESFKSGRMIQGLILILNFEDYHQMIYSISLDILRLLFSQNNVQEFLYINDLNVLLTNIFPLLCRSNNFSVDSIMEKMILTLTVLLKISKNNNLYEEIPAFRDALENLSNENGNPEQIQQLISLI